MGNYDVCKRKIIYNSLENETKFFYNYGRNSEIIPLAVR